MNKIKFKHFIIIAACIYLFIVIFIFLYAGPGKYIINKNSKPISSIKITPLTPKPTIDKIAEAEKEEIKKYNKWFIPISNQLSLLFKKIALDCGEYNLQAVKKDFELLGQIRANFEKKEYPNILNEYQNDMINMFIEYDNVYIALLENDAAGVQFYAEKANGYMDNAIEEYIKVLTQYKI